MTSPAASSADSSHPVAASRYALPWLRPELVAPWWEIALVLAVMLGPFIYSSTRFAVSGSQNYVSAVLSDRKFLGLIATESLLLTGMFCFLRWRGWTPADFGIRRSWKGGVLGVIIALGGSSVNAFVVSSLTILVLYFSPHPNGMTAAFAQNAPQIAPHSIHVTWLSIVFGSTINAFLEELVFMGYAFNQFAAKRGPAFALVMMVILRMLLHTYQGPVHVLGIGAFSVFFGLAYWYFRRIWPLIVAHALIDITSFSLLKLIFG